MSPLAFARSLAAVAITVATVAPSAGAQALLDRSARVGPQFVSYRFDTRDQRSITQLAVPIAVAFTVGERFNVDLATAWASARYEAPEGKSAIDGLTDTQLRATYTFGADNVVLTAGMNLPTGQATVDLARQGAAAGQIGNDFLAFPISNMGTGMGGTGGIAAARAAGAWNVGAGASFRRTVAYDAFSLDTTRTVRFEPGDEYRLRVGADRTVGAGALMLGATYFAFGADGAGGTTYSSGDRVVTLAAYSRPMDFGTLQVAAWDLHRMSGRTLGNVVAPSENIANLAIATGFRAGRHVLEPNVEVRGWRRDGDWAGTMAQLGVRGRFGGPSWHVLPSIAFATGSVGSDPATKSGFAGWRGGVMVEVR